MSTTPDAQQYRYNQVREWQSELKTVIEVTSQKVKKYKRRITVLDIMVYSVSAVVASAGAILSAVTPVTAAVAATICVSAATTTAGVFGIIAKKISSCANTKLHDYTTKLNTATTAYQKLSSLISSSLDVQSSDATISDSEFKLMSDAYNDYLKTKQINNVNRTASTNSHKHNTGKDHNDLSVLDDTRIRY